MENESLATSAFQYEYRPKEYWEGRAKSWIVQASDPQYIASHIEVDQIMPFLKEIGAKSVIDIGCGDGRWYPFLKDAGITDYAGIDISKILIDAAKKRFPEIENAFVACKVEDARGTKKQDLVFSYTCLEHIKEEDFEKAVTAIKSMAKQALLIEPENFESRDYCHNHDYRKHFNVIKEEKLKDKTIFLINL